MAKGFVSDASSSLAVSDPVSLFFDGKFLSVKKLL
jgi:hypothetical protein